MYRRYIIYNTIYALAGNFSSSRLLLADVNSIMSCVILLIGSTSDILS